MVRSSLYTGTLMHARSVPVRHVFRHRVLFFALDLDELDELDHRVALFGYNRRNVVSFHDGDHLGEAGRPAKANVLAFLAVHGIDPGPGARVVLVTNLRTLGYVFNPISFFYCYGAGGELAAVVAEVGNTFGERHSYVLSSANRVSSGAREVYEHSKRMHVSPFFGMDQTYRFSLTEPGERIRAGVGIIEGGARPFQAELTGTRRPLTTATLARALARHPLMSQRVSGLIHWHAGALALKGVPVHHKPRFAPDSGSGRATQATPPTRRGLRLPPPARLSPLAGAARRIALAALAHPAAGRLRVRLPDGTVRSAGDPASGPEVEMAVRSKNLWRRLATRGRLAIGESYVAGDWTTDDLVGLLEILALSAERARRRPPWSAWTRLQRRRPRLPAGTGLAGARRDIAYHYDLGNDLYEMFLDPSLTYSCAVFERPDMTLQEAQEAKYRRICDKLALGPSAHVLEIGCGWGGFARHAARERGARVTGITLSQRQAELARRRIADEGLEGLIDIRLIDYRELRGSFSHIVSIEMLEAVAHADLPGFFGACDRLLAPGGTACIQTIAVPDQTYERYRRGNDWIREYVFPGANIPSLGALSRAMTRASSLIVHDAENIGDHYAPTLRAWREAFLARRADVLALGHDEPFIRGWEFYLAFCEAGFRTRALHDYQLVLRRPFSGRMPMERDTRTAV